MQTVNVAILKEVVFEKMPFGKYKGWAYADIPVSYLEWLHRQGFPPGKVGMLLSTIYEIKINGLEALLQPIRKMKS